MNFEMILENLRPQQLIGVAVIMFIIFYYIYQRVEANRTRALYLNKKQAAELELAALNKEYGVKVVELQGQFAKRPKLTRRGKK